jgi:aryl-alcohol dehydrogenase-like predicted oxidoreductase
VFRFGKENFPNILKIADAMKQIGEKHNATAGQVSLAWLLAQGNDVIPIPGTTKIKVCFELSRSCLISIDICISISRKI